MSAAPLNPRLTAVLQHFQLSPLEVRTVSGGFSGARVCRVKTTDQQLIALRWSEPANAAELERREAICRWMHFARAAGCHWAPQPLKPNATALTTSTAPFLLTQPDGWWQAETWMPGCPVDAAPTPAQLQQTLTALAQLHHTARCWALHEFTGGRGSATAGLRLANGVSPGLERRLQLVRQLQSGALTRLLAAAAQDPDGDFRQLSLQLQDTLQQQLPDLHQQLEKLAPQSFTLQPVLRDLWQPHVLFSDDQVTGVIDWNAAATDHPAFDYSRLLASWYGQQAVISKAQLRPEHWTPAEHQLLQVCLKASLLLSPITWLQRRCAAGPATQPLPPDVLNRFRRLVVLACGTTEYPS